MNKLVLIKHPNKNRRTISFNWALSENRFYYSYVYESQEGVPVKAIEIREKLLKVNLVTEASVERYQASFAIQDGFEEDSEECNRIESETIYIIRSIIFNDEPCDIRFIERTWCREE